MMKNIARCEVCGKVGDRNDMVIYHSPTGPKIVCKKCYQQLQKTPIDDIKTPSGKKRKPSDDFFPPPE
jgi:ribosome-binding protein aMBF1 (putative translation factor)